MKVASSSKKAEYDDENEDDCGAAERDSAAPLKIPSVGGGEGLRSLHRGAGVGWFRVQEPP